MAENLKISLSTNTPEVKIKANVPNVVGEVGLSSSKINFISVGQRGSVGPAGPAGTITEEQQAAINANTAKTGITTEQANAIVINTGKNGVTTEQALAITANTNKISYPPEDAAKLAGIQAGAEVNTQADWNITDPSSDAYIQNKPTIPTDTNTTYSVSCVDGDNSDEEKIRLTDSSGSTDDVVLEAGTGLSIARSGDKITFTNTVTDTDTVLTTEQVQDIVGAMFSGNTETNITVTYEDSDGTIDLVATDTNTQLTTEQVQDIVGAMFTSNTETRISATYEDSDGTIDLVVDDMTADTNTQLTDEQVQDIVGAMVDGGTETNISVTYDDSSGKLNFVSTDTNTTYSEATGSAAGLMSIAHHDKLDGIETSADVTDTTNVTAAGALMDSELTDLAGVKSLDTSTLVTLSDTQTISGGKTFTKPLILDGDKSVTASSDGVAMHVDAQDITDSSTSASGTATVFSHVVVENPRIMATNSSVTTTTANTVYIKGAPVASTNQTITNAYSLNVAGGNVNFGADLAVGGDLDITGNILPGITTVKILPHNFMADDGGRPVQMDDTGSDRFIESFSTNPLYASIEIPQGFKATHVHVYGSGTSAMTVYEADINSKTVTSKGTGNIGTNLNITDVTADATNYILIELVQTSSEEVYGGVMTIAKV
jgi:hypothetical protein